MHRRTVSDFDLKFRKLEKLQIKLPLEILAFELLRKFKIEKARINACFEWCELCL